MIHIGKYIYIYIYIYKKNIVVDTNVATKHCKLIEITDIKFKTLGSYINKLK